MKIISWNVNGIRAAYKKGLADFIQKESPDILCLQETKAWPEQLTPEDLNPHGYKSLFSSASKKGYSGTAIFYKPDTKLALVDKGIGDDYFDHEGRFLIVKLGDYLLYNIYYPSGTSGDERQNYKYKFLDAIYDHIQSLSPQKRNKMIMCGDFNICHKEIDIHHPKQAERLELSGFLPDERAWMDKIIGAIFTDTFRMLNQDVKSRYSWWSYRAGARQKNLGWRIDYFLVANKLKDKIINADILDSVLGSDHAPILLEIENV